MKKTIYFVLTFASIFITSQVLTYSTGPVAGMTNAPGESNCTSCHGGSSLITSGSNWDNITLVQNSPYGTGTVASPFTFTLSFSDPSSVMYGFQLCALPVGATSSSASIGTISANPISAGNVQIVSGVNRDYLEHTSSGTAATNNTNSWTFDWVPPTTGFTGSVQFFICVNSTNSDGTSSGDTIYAKTFTFQLTPIVHANITALLQGTYLGSNTMTAAPFNADGVSPSNIADTVTVELHGVNAPYPTLFSSYGLLGTNGQLNMNFPNATDGNSYYIALKHRNSIATWSANPVPFSSTATSYDFTSGLSQSYGNNTINDGTGLYLIFSGDINQDGSIDFNDYPDLDIASSNGNLGYESNDLNGDASVDFNDYPILDINSSNGVISVTP